MATTNTPKKAAAKKTAGFSDVEKEAMKARAREAKAASSRKAGEDELLKAIAAMTPADRAIAEKLHALVGTAAPQLWPKTWYGMPAWAKDGEVICFFKAASKFKERYATFGFNTPAKIDDGPVWPTSWAVVKLTTSDEAKFAALVKKAVA